MSKMKITEEQLNNMIHKAIIKEMNEAWYDMSLKDAGKKVAKGVGKGLKYAGAGALGTAATLGAFDLACQQQDEREQFYRDEAEKMGVNDYMQELEWEKQHPADTAAWDETGSQIKECGGKCTIKESKLNEMIRKAIMKAIGYNNQ